MPVCPAEECSKEFPSYKALSAHMARCKFMPQAMTAAAKHYVEIGRKRLRTLSPTAAGDEEEVDDNETADFEVCCCDISTCPCQFLMIYEQSQAEEPQQPSPPLPEDPSEVPEPSGSRPRRNAQLPLRFRDTGLDSYLPNYMSQRQQREAAAAEEAARQTTPSTPTPPPHPATPIELQTIQTESDEFG